MCLDPPGMIARRYFSQVSVSDSQNRRGNPLRPVLECWFSTDSSVSAAHSLTRCWRNGYSPTADQICLIFISPGAFCDLHGHFANTRAVVSNGNGQHYIQTGGRQRPKQHELGNTRPKTQRFNFCPTHIFLFFCHRTSGTFGFARHTSQPTAKPKEPLFANALFQTSKVCL